MNSGPDLDRTMFFSDAVFAIAMTLLAVDIRVPQVPANELGEAVAAQLPEFGAYVLSFVVTAAYWLSHHRLFRLLRGFTGRLQQLNLVLLLFVALLGYATDMLAFYGDQVLGVVIYAAALGLIGTANTGLWIYCSRTGLFRDDVDPRLPAFAQVRAPVTPAVFLASIPIAILWSPEAAIWSWLGIVIINALLHGLGRRRTGSA
ncbi:MULTISPECIES: TMEM175 family protein [unclassified Arthrobacter]|uniref:TMEM175 family protein n=1 Tax=unclassified Arthrobacter TaxID=235627 RepID=UPI0021078E32|nr:TMEM175 family protein [Arthrobacter sp. zg-Y1116]MCQ1988254.1 TMEM175 family protein [Arthrobacter sp. zg-Y844]